MFLSFVECLREDSKYAKLVEMLDKALAEYDREHDSTHSEVTALLQVTSPTLEQSNMSVQQNDDPLTGKGMCTGSVLFI